MTAQLIVDEEYALALEENSARGAAREMCVVLGVFGVLACMCHGVLQTTD